jgi:hypothetical protein
VRRQLSLFVPADAGAAIESVRRLVDPMQHRLIPAHVTLCRDDELADLAGIRARLEGQSPSPLTLRFGPAEPFAGHGWLLPCIDGEARFRALRQQLLGGVIREQRPHVTLAHPRNPRAVDDAAPLVTSLPPVIAVTFAEIALIEQDEATQPWRVVWSRASYPS